jgi:hypothetical protein
MAFPPRLLAEAAVGAAILAVARTESLEELEDGRASERLRASTLEGRRAFGRQV